MNIDAIRLDFPILSQIVHGNKLVYLDNAATTQKPQTVIDRISNFYSTINSNIHRGVYSLSEQSEAAYDKARQCVRDFIGAEKSEEIIFTRGTTESINLVAQTFAEAFLNKGDEIIVSEMEHNSNIVPWQIVCNRKGTVMKIIPFDDDGRLQVEQLDKLIGPKTKLIALSYISNTLGTLNPVEKIIKTAHSVDIPVLIDGAQAAGHLSIDVKKMDCDFFAFSGHKVYAATGIGVLYGKEKWLEKLPPYQSGGGMVESVSPEKTCYAELPLKFEAGTPHYVGAVSLDAALQYINNIGMDKIALYEHDLITYAEKRLDEIDNLKIYGPPKEHYVSLCFNIKKLHHYDVGIILDKYGIAVRTGRHCADMVMQHYDITGAVRASFALYNTTEEIDILVKSLKEAKKLLLQ